MNSSPRFWLTAGAIVALSLTPKIALGWLREATPAPPGRTEALRRYLASVSDGPVTPIRGGQAGREIVGWRFAAGRCAASAFPSGPSGTFDIAAGTAAHGLAKARTAYVYRGAVSARAPAWPMAFDTLAFRAISAFSPAKANPPGYTVLVFQDGCGAATKLPWGRFRSG